MNKAKVIEQARDLLATEMPWEEQIISGLSQVLDDGGWCEWQEDESGDYWNTACGQQWCFDNAEDPKTNGVNYCHGCGKRLLELPPQPED